MAYRKPILVTGSHRSGSTWIGRVISQSPVVYYIHEPFNIDHPPGRGICGAKFNYWFTYISDDNSHIYVKQIRNMINLRFNFVEELKSIRSRNDVKRAIGDCKSFMMGKFFNKISLVKDPIALFSAEWLAKTFDMNVVVLIRHPAAFVSSIKILEWVFPFSHFLKQPPLMRDHLSPFESEIRHYVKTGHKDLIGEAILLWRIVHHVIIKYRSHHKDWIFLRHKDVSQDPLNYFRDLFKRFNLELTQNVRKFIVEQSDSSNPRDPKDNFSIKRNSKLNILNWKERLTKFEIKRIRENSEDIWSEFYSSNDW